MRFRNKRARLKVLALDLALLACCVGLWYLPLEPRIDRALYDRIEIGMSEAQVRSLMPGSPRRHSTVRKTFVLPEQRVVEN